MKFLFLPMDAAGHINACVGIASILRRCGHDCLFAVAKEWISLIEKSDLTCEVYQDPRVNDVVDPQAKWGSFMKKFSPSFKMSPYEQVEHLVYHTRSEFLEFTMQNNSYFEKLIERTKPDAIFIDFLCTLPAIIKSRIPWILVWSCAPLYVYEKVGGPPCMTGFSPFDDPKDFQEYLNHMNTVLEPIISKCHEWLRSEGVEPPSKGMITISPYLNVYVYPPDIDYREISDVPEKWFRLDHVVREADDSPLGIDESVFNSGEKLIYFSLGSMGSADVDLVRHLLAIMSKASDRKFIVSKGPYHGQIQLYPNMVGAKYLNQLKILPLVDLVITHGGNNTFVETLYFGKTMIVMPLFGDQHENGRRVEDCKIGKCFHPYQVTEAKLLGAIEDLLNDQELNERVAKIGERLRKSNSHEKFNEKMLQVLKKNLIQDQYKLEFNNLRTPKNQ